MKIGTNEKKLTSEWISALMQGFCDGGEGQYWRLNSALDLVHRHCTT
jgi:hypothetical protein